MHSIIGVDKITSSVKILFTSSSLMQVNSKMIELSNEILEVVLDDEGNEIVIPSYSNLIIESELR